MKQRLDKPNRSTAVPFAFCIYATYEVDSALSDKKLHFILDKLNPELRSKEDVDGKRRIREFYAMTPEDAFSILEAIAEINGYRNRLKKWKATANEQRDEALAQEINEQTRNVWRRLLSQRAVLISVSQLSSIATETKTPARSAKLLMINTLAITAKHGRSQR